MLIEPGRIEVREVDEPRPGSRDASVRIRAVGICGTDLSIFRGKIPVAYPRIIGHEMVGQVLTSADGAPPPGTRVIVDPNVACLRCARCREGRANLCAQGWLLGRDRDGALRETVVVPAENLHRLPEDVPDHVAPVIQVLTTVIHGQRRVPIFPGETVVVVGLGVTGLLHVQVAKLRGANLVVGTTRSPERLALARALGADVLVPADVPDVEDRIRDAMGGGADVAIESAGTSGTLGLAMRVTRSGGRVLSYGTIAQQTDPLPLYDLYYKELEIVAARAAQAEDYPVALGAVASGSVRLEPLVARRVSLGAVGETLAEGSVSGLKTVVEVAGSHLG